MEYFSDHRMSQVVRFLQELYISIQIEKNS